MIISIGSLVFSAALWGSTFFLVKDLVRTVNPITLVAWRFLASAGILALILGVLRRPLWTEWKSGMVVGAWLFICIVPQTIGLQYTSAANSGFITGLFIGFVPLSAYLMDRTRPSWVDIAAIAVSLAGLWILVGGMKRMNVGDGLTVVTAWAYAMGIITTDRALRRGCDPLRLAFQQFMVTGLVGLAWSASSGQFVVGGSSSVLWPMVFLVVGPTVMAFFLTIRAQQSVGPVLTGLVLSLEPVFAAFFAWTIGGETGIPRQMIGGGLIVAAIALPDAWRLVRKETLERGSELTAR